MMFSGSSTDEKTSEETSKNASPKRWKVANTAAVATAPTFTMVDKATQVVVYREFLDSSYWRKEALRTRADVVRLKTELMLIRQTVEELNVQNYNQRDMICRQRRILNHEVPQPPNSKTVHFHF